MSIFETILKKVTDPWGVAEKQKREQEPGGSPSAPPRAAQPRPADATPGASAPAATVQEVDVEKVLDEMASKKPVGGGNWRTSIVDLLKLLDMDSSLNARKELADELGVHEGDAGSAGQNIALHRAVMRQLAANGGKVPADLRD